MRAPTIALKTQSHPMEIANALAEHGIMAGASDFYAVRPLGAMNIPIDPGVLRLSFVHYTAKEDIDALITALDQTL